MTRKPLLAVLRLKRVAHYFFTDLWTTRLPPDSLRKCRGNISLEFPFWLCDSKHEPAQKSAATHNCTDVLEQHTRFLNKLSTDSNAAPNMVSNREVESAANAADADAALQRDYNRMVLDTAAPILDAQGEVVNKKEHEKSQSSYQHPTCDIMRKSLSCTNSI